jgi:hypothetical protein
MADKFLRFKTIPGTIVEPPDENSEWIPSELCNDFYPKYVMDKNRINLWGNKSTDQIYAGSILIDAGNEEYLAGLGVRRVVFEQKSEFIELNLEPNFIVIQPENSGWGISVENVLLFYKGKKWIINHKVIENRNPNFKDTFLRFNSMYTFDNKVDATSVEKEEVLKKSWNYL